MCREVHEYRSSLFLRYALKTAVEDDGDGRGNCRGRKAAAEGDEKAWQVKKEAMRPR